MPTLRLRSLRRPSGSAVRRLLRRGARLALLGAVLAAVTVVASVTWVRSGAAGHIYTEQSVPAAPVALVLGAQVYEEGSPSPFLAARLELARRLFVAGKVRAILVSGDHMNWGYNEPGSMHRWLVERDVPAEKIVLDHAGFDTYDSCVRAKRIFGVQQAIVVTQTFHIERAVTLCRRQGVDASGVGDDTVSIYRVPWRVSSTREYPAAVKAALDTVSGRDPVHLGRRETGVDDALRDN
jgi:vancomycin permeability regulator SanA